MVDRPSRSAPPAVEPLSSTAAAVVSRRAIVVAMVLATFTLVVFRLYPDLDLGAARDFYAGDNHFVGQAPWGETLRRIFYWAPLLMISILLALYGARRFGREVAWAPGGRGLVFLAASLALGPGLIVNVVLKDHSHRPRPMQTAVFGGTMPFRPVGSFDGACARNCSFVSGEGSSAFWTVAPALLAPASVQPPVLVAALCFGVAASLLRMAFGGHYLSDTIMAALLTWLVIAGTWRVVFRASRRQDP